MQVTSDRATGPVSTPSAGAAGGDLDALLDAVRRAAADRTPLAIRGGNTKGWYGQRVDATMLDTRSHAGVVDYEPSELVIVARAGTPLKDIESLLAAQRQMLAFEPPHFAPGLASSRLPSPGLSGDNSITRALAGRGATLGGCVAAGLSGPRRMAAGPVRDFVLGARLIDGRGQHLAFGGQVMKNVAGYDVSRALAGSLGTLGVITEVSLKVLPKPAQSTTLALAMGEADALDKLNRWAGLPIAITASAWRGRPSSSGRPMAGRLTLRLEGSDAAVEAAIRRIGGIDIEPAEADAWWFGIREQTDTFFTARSPDLPLWRLALPSIAPPLDAVALGFDDQLIEWGGALRWIATRAEARVVRAAAAKLGGHATLWRAADEARARIGVFTPLSAPALAIHQRLKAEFDPHRIFNPGRWYPDF